MREGAAVWLRHLGFGDPASALLRFLNPPSPVMTASSMCGNLCHGIDCLAIRLRVQQGVAVEVDFAVEVNFPACLGRDDWTISSRYPTPAVSLSAGAAASGALFTTARGCTDGTLSAARRLAFCDATTSGLNCLEEFSWPHLPRFTYGQPQTSRSLTTVRRSPQYVSIHQLAKKVSSSISLSLLLPGLR
jgi:hypothetical protein